MINESTIERDFIRGTSSYYLVTDATTVIKKTLERCFVEKIDKEMSNIIDTVEDKIQNAISTVIDSIVAPKIELAIKSVNLSSGQNATSVAANLERREHVLIFASFENAFGNNNALHVSNRNDDSKQRSGRSV